jgi:hypothetical protein
LVRTPLACGCVVCPKHLARFGGIGQGTMGKKDSYAELIAILDALEIPFAGEAGDTDG